MNKLKEYLLKCKWYNTYYIADNFLSSEVLNILDKYKFTLHELCYRLKNNIPLDKKYLCKNCNNLIKFKPRIFYQKFCCHKCAVEYINKQPGHMDKVKETCRKRYNTDNVFKLKTYQDKAKQSMLARYNVEYALQDINFMNKCYYTKKKNKTSCSSKPEKEVGRLLRLKFKDVRSQYKSKEYPFACDYYVGDIDTYIECNYHISHGKNLGFFDKNNPEHIALVNKWKVKNTAFYLSAIKIWTIKDPLKYKIAKQNNLKYKVFWDLDLTDFLSWYNNIDTLKEPASATF